MSSELEWRQWLLGYARRWCRSDDDAHDLVQETLIAFFVKHREHLPWEWSDSIEAQRHALRLLHDKYAEYCRRQRRAFSYEELVATVPDPAQSEQALYEQLHDAQLLAQIATRLSPRQQTVLNLLREGYEQHEIAEQMHISLGAVKRYLHLIRRKAAELGASDATFHPPTSGINNGIPQIGGWRDETMDEWSYGANDDCSSSAATGGG